MTFQDDGTGSWLEIGSISGGAQDGESSIQDIWEQRNAHSYVGTGCCRKDNHSLQVKTWTVSDHNSNSGVQCGNSYLQER